MTEEDCCCQKQAHSRRDAETDNPLDLTYLTFTKITYTGLDYQDVRHMVCYRNCYNFCGQPALQFCLCFTPKNLLGTQKKLIVYWLVLAEMRIASKITQSK